MGCSMTMAKKAEVILSLIFGHLVVITSGMLFKKLYVYKQTDFGQDLISKFSHHPFRADTLKYAGTSVEFIKDFIYYTAAAAIAIGGLQMLCSIATLPVLFIYGEKSLAGGCCYKIFEIVTSLTLGAVSAFAILQAFFSIGFHPQWSLALVLMESGQNITFEYWAWIGSMSLVAIYALGTSCIVEIYKTWKKVEKTASIHEKLRISEPNQSVVLTEVRDINVKLNDV